MTHGGQTRMIRRTLAVLLALVAAPSAQAEWREATSRHFVLYGDTSEANLRRQAEALERLDWGLRRFMQVEEEPEIASRKVTVYLVSDGDVQRLCRCRDAGGFYFSHVGGSTAISGAGGWTDQADAGRIILFHEYAHHFMFGTYSLAFPAWFTEGFAEFASTAKVEPERISLGHAAQHRAYSLFGGPRLTAAEMFDPALRTRLNRDKLAAFYGSGWLMTHFFMFEPGRYDAFRNYVMALNAGMPGEQAVVKAFGDLKALDRAIQAYLRRPRLTGVFMRYGDTPAPPVTLRVLSPGEAALIDRRMESVRGVNKEEAGRIFTRAAPIAARYPADAMVQGWFAEMAYDADQDEAAELAARRAVAADPRSMQGLMYIARVKLRRLQAAKSTDAKAWADARRAVVAANRADPNDAEPLWLFWRSFAMEGRTPSPSAIRGLYKAQELMPQDSGVRFAAARARIEAGETDQARNLLRPLAYHPHAPADNAAARMLAALDAGKKGAEVLALGAAEAGAGEKEE